MKFIEKPSPENFLLTAKKKIIIKSLMYNFFQSKEYDLFKDKNYKPTSFEFKKFILDRCIFLGYINCHFAIVTHQEIWTTLYFIYYDEYIILNRKDIDKELQSNPFTRKVDIS